MSAKFVAVPAPEEERLPPTPEQADQWRRTTAAFEALVHAFGGRTSIRIPLREPAINIDVDGIPRDVTRAEMARIVRVLWALVPTEPLTEVAKP